MAEPHVNTTQSHEIGEKLKSFRKAHGLSIRVLAEKASLSPNTISLIESSASSPTVATLQTIANVLDIPLSAFFTNPEPEDDVVLIKAQDQDKQVTPGLSVSVFPSHVLDHRVRVMHFAIGPGASSGNESLVHPGDELVMCLQGELEYVVMDRVYRLKKQDSLAFKAHLPHSWYNRSQAETHFLVLITTETDLSFRAHVLPSGQ